MCATALLSSCHIYKTYERPGDVHSPEMFRDTASNAGEVSTDTASMANLPWREVFTDPQGIYPKGDTALDNLWTRAYKERLGVNFTAAWTGEKAALPEQIEIMAASDALPDYMVLPYDAFYAKSRNKRRKRFKKRRF